MIIERGFGRSTVKVIPQYYFTIKFQNTLNLKRLLYKKKHVIPRVLQGSPLDSIRFFYRLLDFALNSIVNKGTILVKATRMRKPNEEYHQMSATLGQCILTLLGMDDASTMFGFIHIFYILFISLYFYFFFLDTELSKDVLILVKVKFIIKQQISYFRNQILL